MSRRTFFCIDAHTCGNPVRVVTGGGPPLHGWVWFELLSPASDPRPNLLRRPWYIENPQLLRDF